MKVLKKMVRKHEKPLEQVIKRYEEILEFCKHELVIPTTNIIIKLMKPYNEGPLINDKIAVSQFKTATINDIKINITSISDCYIGFEELGKLNICKVVNICKNIRADNEIVFVVNIFNKVEPYFDKPINSLKLGIAVVDNLLDNFVQVNIHKTKFKKYMIISSNQDLSLIAFPILHTN